MTANGYKCCVTPIGRKEKSTCHISFFLPLWECCGGRRVLGINILIARDSPSNDGAILFSKSWGEKGGTCHLVFCLSFLAFAPRMIPFRHTRQRSLKRRTKNKYQKKGEDLGILRIQTVAPPSGDEDRQKRRTFSLLLVSSHDAHQDSSYCKYLFPVVWSRLIYILLFFFLLFFFFSRLDFLFLFENSPSSRLAQQINKYNKNGIAHIKIYKDPLSHIFL